MKPARIFSLALLALLLTFYTTASAQQPTPSSRELRFDFRGLRGSVISTPIAVPLDLAEPFLAIGARWTGADGRIAISLRASVDGTTWSDWRTFGRDSDSEIAGEAVGALLLLDARTRWVQFRTTGAETDKQETLTALRLIFINPGTTPRELRETIAAKTIQGAMNLDQLQLAKYPKPPIVTRTEWGCPDGQITTHGTLSYTTVTHLVVHHTFSPDKPTNGDWAALVRSVWQYHVFSNGWADIGYNYVIDQNGVIYEGRAGGDNVVGAHFSGVNSNTMGVVVIGDFTKSAPPPAALNSLKKLLAWKADQRGIDPAGQSRHAASGLTLNNVCGHRDGPGATECPGDAFYPLLPQIRLEVKTLLTGALSTATSVSAASFAQSPLASESIVALFGTELAAATSVAQSAPLPFALGGTSVVVRDSAGIEKIAPLFFVSPGQINFLMPTGLSLGPATVIAVNAEGHVASGSVTISSVAPGLFAANADGRGVPAAVVLRIKTNGVQVYEPVAVFDAQQNEFIAAPIELGSEGEQVFLVAYGTGLRGRSALNAVSGRLGGETADVLFAGAVTGFSGLDQLNLRIPRALAGRGEVGFELTVDGQVANSLKLKIK